MMKTFTVAVAIVGALTCVNAATGVASAASRPLAPGDWTTYHKDNARSGFLCQSLRSVRRTVITDHNLAVDIIFGKKFPRFINTLLDGLGFIQTRHEDGEFNATRPRNLRIVDHFSI